MSILSEFFDRSEFVARPKTTNTKNIEVDIEYRLELDIYDVIGLDTPALVTSTLALQDGRNLTVLPTVVQVSDYGEFSYLFIFTVATEDWDGNADLTLQLNVIDHDSYSYSLPYQLKV